MEALLEAPSILANSRTRKNGYDLSFQIRNQCEDAIRSQSEDFARGHRAWSVYRAINGSQYTDKKLKVYKEEDRHPWQFDFTSAKVDTLAGTIIAELPDPDWTPILGQSTEATEAIKECYYLDKELFNFQMVLLETIRDGCVHSGWCQIGESRKYHPSGNISLFRVRPGYLVPDPYWMTSDDRDLTCAYKLGWYDAEAMKRIWNARSDEIDRAIYERKQGRQQIAPNDRREMYQDFRPNVGDEWRVIEKHYLEIKNTARLIGLQRGAETLTRQLLWIPFPVTDNRALLEKFAEANDIDWESVQEVPYEQRTHKVATVTDLDPNIVLEDGKSRIQPNGLPFLHYTTCRVDGQDKGVVESIQDLQMMFNERMSHIHEMIAKASGGSELINEDLFRDPQQRQRFVKNANKPGHKEFVPLDDVKVPRVEIDAIQVNPAIFQQVSVIYNELLPLISRVSDSMSAMSSSEDTGILFERKYQMNRIANILYDKFAKQLVNSLGEAYFYQWQVTYADTERDVATRSGKTIQLNKVIDNGDGSRVMINSVAHVPRVRTVVTENTQSATNQMYQRMQIKDIIKAIPEGDYLRLNQVIGDYFGTLNLPDKQKAMQEMVTEMNNMKAKLQYMTEISGMKAQIANNQLMTAQTEQMLQQMMGQMMAAGAQQPQAPTQPQVSAPQQQVGPVEPMVESFAGEPSEGIPMEQSQYMG
jgi:hypothetical protein